MMPISIIKLKNLLPYEQSYDACDVETRQEVKICTGEWIHAFTLGDKMYVSEQAYQELLKTYTNDTSK